MIFPLCEKPTALGKIPDPQIPVSIKTRFGFISYQFLLDTGADFTTLPASLADPIGLNLLALRQTKLYGVEGRGMMAFVASVTLKIGQYVFEVPAFLTKVEATPMILGRAGLFDRFNILFDNRRKVIRISPLKISRQRFVS